MVGEFGVGLDSSWKVRTLIEITQLTLQLYRQSHPHHLSIYAILSPSRATRLRDCPFLFPMRISSFFYLDNKIKEKEIVGCHEIGLPVLILFFPGKFHH